MIKRISQEEFAARRARLMDAIGENAVAIVASATMQERNSDVEYPFRQHSDFYYLTGFDEPDAVLVLRPGAKGAEYCVFCQPRDKQLEIWHGYRTGPEGLEASYGVDVAFSNEELDQQMPKLLDGREQVLYSLATDESLDQQVGGWINTLRGQIRQGAEPPEQLALLDSILHEMRLIKSAEEADVMRAAGELSAQAHRKAMACCKPGMFEFQLEAEISYHLAYNGCRLPAYSSIVGGGVNACVLHYTENKDLLTDGDLVLIDAGCEMDYYAADITRTFPVNGKFNAEQKAVYELVLKTHQACIEMIRPGVIWESIHERSVELLTEGLVELGLLSGDRDELIEQGAYREFYMHRIGHWLGMDVHDVGRYKQEGESRPLRPGMVMTVEPGIYISPDNQQVEARWRGIGVRVEDDILITETGYENLTASVPVTVDEIEALMAGESANA